MEEILRLLKQNAEWDHAVAIYCLWENDTVVYVGSAKDPESRLAAHRRVGFLGRSVEMEVMAWVSADRRDAVEKYAIKLGLNGFDYPLENIMWRY